MKKLDALWDDKIQPRLRDAGRQLLGRHPRRCSWRSSASSCSARSSSAFTERPPATASTSWSTTTCCRSPRSSSSRRRSCSSTTRSTTASSPRWAPRRPRRTGKSILFLLEANPGPGLGLLLAYTVFGKGLAKASAPGCGDHPVLRRHPRDLLPVRADEAEADPGRDPRRHDRRVHQRALRLRPAGARGARLDHRGLRADAPAAASSASRCRCSFAATVSFLVASFLLKTRQGRRRGATWPPPPPTWRP